MVGLVALGLWVAIYLLPDLWWHHLQWGAYAGSRESGQVALTFDDGPGAETAAILDVLREHATPATFFVVVERAEHHPELIQRMLAEGHAVALHGLSHRSAYLDWPGQPWRELRQAVRRLERLTGKRPRFYRPPWGHHNLFTGLAAKRLGLRRVLWTVAPDDWRAELSSQAIAQRVVQWALPGAVVVLHDGGGDRRRTVEALAPMIAGLRAMGLRPVTLDDLPEEHSLLRRLWTWWETRFTRDWDVDSVPDPDGDQPVLRVGRIRYQGPKVRLGDGTELARGAPFAEIHFGNPALSRFSGEPTAALRALSAVRKSLPELSRYLAAHPKYQEVVAVGGITVLDVGPAIERMGFRRIPVKGWPRIWMWVYLVLLMAVYHRAGWKTLKRFFRLRPVLVVISRAELDRRYGREQSAQPRKV
ncbi:MAG: polysaccharide deacetylase family protein [Firmicutes bacterium]|nr:polysaccharide deacetylase family protein [Bacillota bacterium]